MKRQTFLPSKCTRDNFLTWKPSWYVPQKLGIDKSVVVPTSASTVVCGPLLTHGKKVSVFGFVLKQSPGSSTSFRMVTLSTSLVLQIVVVGPANIGLPEMRRK